MCSSTQKCSSKDICAVLLSKMDNISLQQCNFFSFKINIPANSNILHKKKIIKQFGVLVSFISGLAHPVNIDVSGLHVCKCKILFNMRKTVQKCH